MCWGLGFWVVVFFRNNNSVWIRDSQAWSRKAAEFSHRYHQNERGGKVKTISTWHGVYAYSYWLLHFLGVLGFLVFQCSLCFYSKQKKKEYLLADIYFFWSDGNSLIKKKSKVSVSFFLNDYNSNYMTKVFFYFKSVFTGIALHDN